MKHKKIFQRAAEEKLIEILIDDTEEILVNKLITSYLYEYYRDNFYFFLFNLFQIGFTRPHGILLITQRRK